MFNGTFKKITFLYIIILCSIFSLSAMDNNTEMVKIIKGGKEMLVPLAQKIKEYAPSIPPREVLKQSSSMLQSSYDLICTHPKATFQFIGYAALFGSILWFLRSKQRFITRGTYAKMDAQKRAAIREIEQEEAELLYDIREATRSYILTTAEKRREEAKLNYDTVVDFHNSLNQRLEQVREEDNMNNAILIAKQKEELSLLIKKSAKFQRKNRDYFLREKQATEQSLHKSFGEFSISSNKNRANIAENIRKLSENMQSYQRMREQSHQATTLTLDSLGNNIDIVENSITILEQADARLNGFEKITNEELAELSNIMDEQQRRLEVFEAHLDSTANNSVEIIFFPSNEKN